MAYYDVNAAIEKPNVLASFRQGQQYGAQMRQQQKAEEDANTLRTLAPQIIAGDPAAYDQAASFAPKEAAAYQDAGDAQMRRLKGAIDFIDTAKKSGNMQAVEAAYQQVRPYLSRFGQEPPATFAEAEPKMEQARARIAMAVAGDKSAQPSGFREFEMTAAAAGLQPGTPEYQQAANIALGREGRASTSGFTQAKFRGDDGRERLGSFNGRTGKIDMPDGTSFDPQTGQQSQTAPQAQAAPQAGIGSDHIANFQTLAANFPGVQISSTNRTPERNREVGGVANSQHMRGSAADFVVPAQQRPAFISALRSQGYEAIDEGDHIHAELPPGRQVASAGGANAFVSRSEEEQAALTEQAKTQVQLANLPQQGQIEAQNAAAKEVAVQAAGLPFAGQKATAVASAERQQKAISDLPRVEQNAGQMISLIDKIINHPGKEVGTGLSSKLNPLNLVPGQPGYDFGVAMDQLRGKAFLQAFETLKGGGQITEVEGKKATDAMGRLNVLQSEGEFNSAMRELRGIVQTGLDKARSQAAQSGQGGQPEATRVSSAADYNNLPSGATYIAPDGTTRRKP